MKTGDLEHLSVQEIVDCSDSTGNVGCDGGYFTSSWEYVVQETGIAKELDYAYLSKASLATHIQHHVHIHRHIERTFPAREHTFISANTHTRNTNRRTYLHVRMRARTHAHTHDGDNIIFCAMVSLFLFHCRMRCVTSTRRELSLRT